jgi:hypothetical protein
VKRETEAQMLKHMQKISDTLESIDGCLFLIYQQQREKRKAAKKKK